MTVGEMVPSLMPPESFQTHKLGCCCCLLHRVKMQSRASGSPDGEVNCIPQVGCLPFPKMLLAGRSLLLSEKWLLWYRVGDDQLQVSGLLLFHVFLQCCPSSLSSDNSSPHCPLFTKALNENPVLCDFYFFKEEKM